jgi:amino acid permease
MNLGNNNLMCLTYINCFTSNHSVVLTSETVQCINTHNRNSPVHTHNRNSSVHKYTQQKQSSAYTHTHTTTEICTFILLLPITFLYILYFVSLLFLFWGTADGGTVVKVLCYKSEGRWFDSRWCHWNFSLT